MDIGKYVYYTKTNSIAKIISYDENTQSYLIDCDGKTINTIRQFIDIHLLDDLKKCRVRCKELLDRHENVEQVRRKIIFREPEEDTTDKIETGILQQLRSEIFQNHAFSWLVLFQSCNIHHHQQLSEKPNLEVIKYLLDAYGKIEDKMQLTSFKTYMEIWLRDSTEDEFEEILPRLIKNEFSFYGVVFCEDALECLIKFKEKFVTSDDKFGLFKKIRKAYKKI